MHPRLINQLFENPDFAIDGEQSLGYIVRDIINMNWWNTAGVLIGYQKNKRVNAPFNETQKRIAVQLKEFYRARIIAIKNEDRLRDELRGYIGGTVTKLEQLSAYSTLRRANPSQYFHKPDGTMTWVDCTSRATYAAKYVFQNGYIDFDGVCRVLGAKRIIEFLDRGLCEDLGIRDHFEDGHNSVKGECFSQKTSQRTVAEWVEYLGVKVLPERQWLLDRIGHVRTDPHKNYEASRIAAGNAPGVNEMLYGFKTSNTIAMTGQASKESPTVLHLGNASAASDASRASDVSRASNASRASHASRASRASGASSASSASSASDASRASRASHASSASDAGCTGYTGQTWDGCPTAITKPEGLEYPKEFRANIFAIAGNWKIDKEITKLAKLGWVDPFSGHGTSPLYAKRHGIRYLGFDTNNAAFDEYLNIVQDECSIAPGVDVQIRCHDSTVFLPELVGQFDLCYTSPPYFNFEEYGGNRGHYEGLSTYSEFHKRITKPVFRNVYQYLIPGGIFALQTEKDKRHQTMWKDVILSLGYKLLESRSTGTEAMKYSMQAKRDQSLLVFER